MSPVLDESLVATAVAVAFKLSSDLETGSGERTSPLGKTCEFTLFGGSKASLQPGSVPASVAGTKEAATSRLEPSIQVALSGNVDEIGPKSEGTWSGISSQRLDVLSQVQWHGWILPNQRPSDYQASHFGCQ